MKTKLKLKLSKTKLGFDQIEIKACLYCNWDNCDKKYKNKKLFDKHQAGHADKLRRMI